MALIGCLEGPPLQEATGRTGSQAPPTGPANSRASATGEPSGDRFALVDATAAAADSAGVGANGAGGSGGPLVSGKSSYELDGIPAAAQRECAQAGSHRRPSRHVDGREPDRGERRHWRYLSGAGGSPSNCQCGAGCCRAHRGQKAIDCRNRGSRRGRLPSAIASRGKAQQPGAMTAREREWFNDPAFDPDEPNWTARLGGIVKGSMRRTKMAIAYRATKVTSGRRDDGGDEPRASGGMAQRPLSNDPPADAPETLGGVRDRTVRNVIE